MCRTMKFTQIWRCLCMKVVVKLKGRTRRLLPLMSQPGCVVQRDNKWRAVYTGGTADIYMNSATVHSRIKKKQVVSRVNERNEIWKRSCVISCLNFWDEAWWFLSLRVFGLLSSSLSSNETIIWRLQVQSWLQASNNTGILNTCKRLWLMESEQKTPVDSIKDVVRSSAKVPKFYKNLKKAGGHIGWNIVEITIKMKTIVRKPLIIRSCVNWIPFIATPK